MVTIAIDAGKYVYVLFETSIVMLDADPTADVDPFTINVSAPGRGAQEREPLSSTETITLGAGPPQPARVHDAPLKLAFTVPDAISLTDHLKPSELVVEPITDML
jgi:hypothetical protein